LGWPESRVTSTGDSVRVDIKGSVEDDTGVGDSGQEDATDETAAIFAAGMRSLTIESE